MMKLRMMIVACALVTCAGPASGEVVVTEPIRTFVGHTSSVVSVAFSPDGTKVLTGSWDRTARLWDAANGACIQTFTGHPQFVRSVAFSPDGTRVLTGSDDATAKLWDAHTGACIRTFSGDTQGGARFVAFSPDGTRVLTGSWDTTAKLWDAANGACIRTFSGHTLAVWSVAFSPDGTRVLTGSWDQTAKLWDAETGACIRTFAGHTLYVSSVAFSPDGTRVLTGSWDQTAKLWDAQTGACIRTFTGHGLPVFSAAFSPSGAIVLTGSCDQTAKLWEAETGACVRTFMGHRSSVDSVAFSADGIHVLTGSEDAAAKLWQAGPVLTVQSQAVAGIAVTGDRSGATDYNTICRDNEVVNLEVPASVISGGRQYNFVRWTVNGAAKPRGQATLQVTMVADHTVVAVYSIQTRALTVRSTPITAANIMGSRPGSTNYTATCDDQEAVTLVAPQETPGPDFAHVFVRWSVDGIEQPDGMTSVTITMDADHSAEAAYLMATRTLIVQSTPVPGVSISGDRTGTANYTAACMDTEVVNLTAPATASIGERNWFFEYWVVDGEPKPRYVPIVSLTMDSDHTAVAVYDCAPAGDVDGNCKVNVLDLIQIRNRLGRSCSQ